MIPTEQAALRTLNIGSTAFIMMSKPLPSSPRIADSGTRTSSAHTGDESLPRNPSPSNDPCTCSPGVPAGTNHSVLNPVPEGTRCHDRTYDLLYDSAGT